MLGDMVRYECAHRIVNQAQRSMGMVCGCGFVDAWLKVLGCVTRTSTLFTRRHTRFFLMHVRTSTWSMCIYYSSFSSAHAAARCHGVAQSTGGPVHCAADAVVQLRHLSVLFGQYCWIAANGETQDHQNGTGPDRQCAARRHRGYSLQQGLFPRKCV